MMKKRTKKFILECVRWAKKHRNEYGIDKWNPYYKLYTNFSIEELEDMSVTELNNLVKLAINCLDITTYTDFIEKCVIESRDKQ